MTRPMTYKFAAPVQRTKLEWTTMFNGNGDGKLDEWTNNGTDYAMIGWSGNDCKDPGGNGSINAPVTYTAPSTYVWSKGQLSEHNKRPVAWDEWMKLYRNCYVTGSKCFISCRAAISGAADGNTAPTWGGLTFHLAPTDYCEDQYAAGRKTEIFAGAPWSTSGNKNQKMKWKLTYPDAIVQPQTATISSASSATAATGWSMTMSRPFGYVPTRHYANCAMSMFKTTKSVFGLKTIFGDEQFMCNTAKNPTKEWSWNFLAQPATATDRVKMTGYIKVTYWCTFSSRKAVSQQQDA